MTTTSFKLWKTQLYLDVEYLFWDKVKFPNTQGGMMFNYDNDELLDLARDEYDGE